MRYSNELYFENDCFGIYDIVPTPKPRQTRSDKWKVRHWKKGVSNEQL